MEKIGIDEISEQIAELEAYDEAVVKLFVQNLLHQIKNELEAGNDVKLDGLGLLSIIEKSGDKFSNLHFEEEFKKEVNEPFSLFEPIELTAANIKESSQELEHKTLEQINEESIEESTPLEADSCQESTSQTLLDEPSTEDTVTVHDSLSADIEEATQEQASLDDEVHSSQNTTSLVEEVVREEASLTEQAPLALDAPEAETEEVANEVTPSSDELALTQDTTTIETQEVIQEKTPTVQIGSYKRPPAHDEEAVLHLRRRKKSVQMNWISIVVFIFIVSVLVCYAPKYISDFKKDNVINDPVVVEQAVAAVIPTDAMSDTIDEVVVEQVEVVTTAEIKKPTVKNEEKPSVVLEEEVKMLPRPRSIVLKKGERLALLARRYYGCMFFWVYIYDYNKAVYPDPDLIPSGAKLLLPPPSEYAMDKDDPKSIERAKDMIRTLKK